MASDGINADGAFPAIGVTLTLQIIRLILAATPIP
jgi:hypothetical protein